MTRPIKKDSFINTAVPLLVAILTEAILHRRLNPSWVVSVKFHGKGNLIRFFESDSMDTHKRVGIFFDTFYDRKIIFNFFEFYCL